MRCLRLFFIGGYYLSKQPSVLTDFETSVQTGGEIEATYLAKRAYEVSYIEQEADVEDYGKYEIYYPAELSESDPVYRRLNIWLYWSISLHGDLSSSAMNRNFRGRAMVQMPVLIICSVKTKIQTLCFMEK